MTILSSRVFYISQCTKCAFIQQCYFYKKQVVINKKYYYKLKANIYQQNCKTISRRFYHRILLTFWKRKIIGLCEYARVSKMRNVTRTKMPKIGVAIWRIILNKLLCFPRCVPELLSHLPKFIEFYLCIQMLPSKNVSWPHFSWPTLYYLFFII